MLEKFEHFKQLLIQLGLWEPFVTGVNIFIPTMAMVYLFGRMLNIAKKDTGKNLVAFFTIVISCGLQVFIGKTELFWKIWDFYFAICVGIILYVLIGFTLYPRIDHFFDKFFARDEDGKRHIRRKKK